MKKKKKDVEEQTQWDKVLACIVGSFRAMPFIAQGLRICPHQLVCALRICTGRGLRS